MACQRELVWAILLLMAALFLRTWVLLEHMEEKTQAGDESLTPSPANIHGCVGVLLRAAARGATSGLLQGAAAVAVVWIAEILSGSKGLVRAVLRVLLLGPLIGAGVGVAEGVEQLVELMGPELVSETVSNGLRGAGVGARVAAVGGATIGSAMSAMAVLAVRRAVKGGGELEVAPLVAASLVAGTARMALSLAPGCMATGALVGSIFGTVRDSRILVALLGGLGLGWYAGLRGLGSPCRDRLRQLRSGNILGGIVVVIVIVIVCVVVLYLGSPPQLHLYDLVSVPLGAAVAYLCWRGGEAGCECLAETVDTLYGAISINAPSGPDEKLLETFR